MTACTGKVCGAPFGPMVYHSRLSTSSEASTTTCRVDNSETSFEVKTGIGQGCTMSAMLFNMTIGWVMRHTTEDQSRGIRWTLFSTLEDLDFADDLALVPHTHQHMQEKTTRLSTYAQQVGLKISQKKTEVMLLNVSNPRPVQVNGKNLPTTEELTYLGSTERHDGGAGSDIKNRLKKARNAFIMHNNVWSSSQYSTKTKLSIYQSWTPEAKRKRRRLRNTECRTVEAELKTMQHIWGSIQKLARNQQTLDVAILMPHAITGMSERE